MGGSGGGSSRWLISISSDIEVRRSCSREYLRANIPSAIPSLNRLQAHLYTAAAVGPVLLHRNGLSHLISPYNTVRSTSLTHHAPVIVRLWICFV